MPAPLYLIRGQKDGRPVLNLTLSSSVTRARQQFARHHPAAELLEIQDVRTSGVVGAKYVTDRNRPFHTLVVRYSEGNQPIQERSPLASPLFTAYCSSPEMYWRIFLASACAAEYITRNRVYTVFTPTQELHSSYFIDSLGNVQPAVVYTLHGQDQVHLLGGTITRPPLLSSAEQQVSLGF